MLYYKMGYGLNIFVNVGINYNIHERDNDVSRAREINDKYRKLPSYIYVFLMECKELFWILEHPTGDCWGNMHEWKDKYKYMDWEELKVEISNLINKYDSSKQEDILKVLEDMSSIKDICHRFTIS